MPRWYLARHLYTLLKEDEYCTHLLYIFQFSMNMSKGMLVLKLMQRGEKQHMKIEYPWTTGSLHSDRPYCWTSECGTQVSGL